METITQLLTKTSARLSYRFGSVCEEQTLVIDAQLSQIHMNSHLQLCFERAVLFFLIEKSHSMQMSFKSRP